MNDGKLIDITFPMRENMAIYPRNPAFSIKKVQDLEKGDGATVSELRLGTHTGTHIDAPSHFIRGGKTLNALPLEAYNGDAVLLEMRGRKVIEAPDLKDKLREAGFRRGDILLLKTDNTESFRCDRVLREYTTLDYEAAQAVADAGAKMVGIDYMTVERPRSMRTPGQAVHTILLGAGVLICETLDLKDVTPGRYRMYCFPMKLEGADGAPARAALEKCL